ncbi:MAG TPA: hypothetical protein VHT75_06975 [Acidimicrobiales bacterium]|nr:hypothetical protein [Acidimicrobiales bacterium]
MEAVGVRTFLHSPNRRPFLASVIGPEAQQLATHDDITTIQVRPGWLGGPHLDLRATGPVDWDGVAAVLAAGSRRHPGTPPSEADYLRQAAGLGDIEGVDAPYPPLRGHGDIELLAGVRADSLGTLSDRGRALLLPPLLGAATADGPGALLAAVAEALLVLADTHPHGLRFGVFSLRSHAEAFFHWAGPAADYRSSFAARMGKEGPVLDQLVRRVQAGDEAGPASEWRYAFNACGAEFAGLNAAAMASFDARPEVTGSAFHRAVAASGVIAETPAWFPGYRLLINLFYQLLPALDIRPVQRFYLCYALAERVDAVVGETWQQRLAAVESLMAASR